HLDEVARMHFLRDARDDGGGGALLHVQDHHLANHFARHGRSFAFDLWRRLDWAAQSVGGRVFDARRFVGEASAAKALALEAVARVGCDLFVAEACDVARARRPIDGQAVARSDVIFLTEVYVNDIADRRRFAPVAREHDAPALLAAWFGEAVEDGIHRRNR